MMLSPQAARMGTAVRCIGKASPRRSYVTGGSVGRRGGVSTVTVFRKSNQTSNNTLLSDNFFRQHFTQQRFKSTTGLASTIEYDCEDDDEEPEVELPSTKDLLGFAHVGHAAAAEHRAKNADAAVAVAEPWMINLGRGNNNAWLMGPRNEQEWFTGVAPVNGCPGKRLFWIGRLWGCVYTSNPTRIEQTAQRIDFFIMNLY